MKIHRFPQYSPEWWTARRGLPTASEFDRIITPKTGKLSASAFGYACQLIGDLYDPMYGQTEDYVSAAMKNGTMMEPRVRAWYEVMHAKVEQVGFITTDDGRLGCSPDGLVGDDGGLECKSPLPKTQIGYLLAGELPDEYRCQVHGCLVVTGRKWWDFVSYCDGLPPFKVRVYPDDFTVAMREALDQFAEQLADYRKRIADMQPLDVPAVEDEFVNMM